MRFLLGLTMLALFLVLVYERVQASPVSSGQVGCDNGGLLMSWPKSANMEPLRLEKSFLGQSALGLETTPDRVRIVWLGCK